MAMSVEYRNGVRGLFQKLYGSMIAPISVNLSVISGAEKHGMA